MSSKKNDNSRGWLKKYNLKPGCKRYRLYEAMRNPLKCSPPLEDYKIAVYWEEKLDIKRNSIREGYFSRKTTFPDLRKLLTIQEHTGYSVEWIEHGTGPMYIKNKHQLPNGNIREGRREGENELTDKNLSKLIDYLISRNEKLEAENDRLKKDCDDLKGVVIDLEAEIVQIKAKSTGAK